MTAAWGEGEVAGESVSSPTEGGFPGELDLGGGITLKLSPDMFRRIMHDPQITAAVDQRCQEVTDLCNSLAITPGAVYTYTVSTNPNNIRGRGRVRPGNFKAYIDNAVHSTLLKALASVGSDPKSVPAAAAERPSATSSVPEDGGGVEASAGEAEAGAVEGGGE
jgi:hypothetical protein